jgi:hypothetical protein
LAFCPFVLARLEGRFVYLVSALFVSSSWSYYYSVTAVVLLAFKS